MTEYIKYSIRNNIENPTLQSITDFCERFLGWDDITIKILDEEKDIWIIRGKQWSEQAELIHGLDTMSYTLDGKIKFLVDIEKGYQVYETLLPYFR
jgi:hypothetical protein